MEEYTAFSTNRSYPAFIIFKCHFFSSLFEYFAFLIPVKFAWTSANLVLRMLIEKLQRF